MRYKCNDCKYGLANVGRDIDCPPCVGFSGFKPFSNEKAMREFIEAEADELEDRGFSVDAERFREFLANLDPCA